MYTNMYNMCSRVQSCLTLCQSMDCQNPLSLEFSRQEYCRGLPFPSLADLLNSGIEPVSLASPALAGGFFYNEPPGNPSVVWTTSLSNSHKPSQYFRRHKGLSVSICKMGIRMVSIQRAETDIKHKKYTLCVSGTIHTTKGFVCTFSGNELVQF